MIRRPKADPTSPLEWLEDPNFPPFHDDYKLPIATRLRAWQAWVDTYWTPWKLAREEYEELHDVTFVHSPHLPDIPFDPSTI